MSNRGPASTPGAGPAAPDPRHPDAGRENNAVDTPIRALTHAKELLSHLEIAIDEATGAWEDARATFTDADTDVDTETSSARIRDLEAVRVTLEKRLVDVEEQMGRLMTLYVATYQLHATLDPEEVKSTIVDIVLNLLGAARFLLLIREERSPEYEIAITHGPDVLTVPAFSAGRYSGGDPLVDTALSQGGLLFGPVVGSQAIAAVALRVQDVTVGALVIFGLLAHKRDFAEGDRELLDLIAAHAASALVASRVCSTMARKLRTLEDLMKLVKGS
jgi:hypothetical protein